MSTKRKQLEVIAREIEACALCKQETMGKAVPGEGNPDAAIVFIGEAPGNTEAACGRPFVGRSGRLLRTMIQSVGLKELDVYITSPVKYLPNRGTPTPAQIAHGRIHLQKQLAVIQPKVIILLGNVATKALLEEKIPILQRHGTIIQRGNRSYFLTLHPAAAIRFRKFRKLLEGDFQRLKEILCDRRFFNSMGT